MTDRSPSHFVSEQGLPQNCPPVLTEADVLITPALEERPARQPDLAAENQAFASLAQQLTDEPQSRLKTLVQIARDLYQADTVGVSLLETLADGSSVFRWVAIAGALESWEQTTTPSNFSLCGTATRCGHPQLYSYPERYFTYLYQLQFPIVEGLLIPICVNDQPLGILWLFSHTEQQQFDREDLRLATSLAGFAAAALQSMHLRQMAGLKVQAEQSLQESEAFNHSVFESSADCIKVLDLDGYVLSLNGPGRCLMEVEDCTPLVGTAWIQFWRDADQANAAQAVKTAQAGGTGQFSGYCPTLKGTPKWWDVVLTPILDVLGKPKQLLVVSRDVSARKQTEQALRENEEQSRSILESISDAFLALNQSWQFTYVNSTAEALLGCASGSLTGKVFWEEFPGLDGSEFEQMYRRVMRDRVAESLTAFYPDHDRWYEVRSYPATDGITIYFRNVTEQIQAEIALRQSEERYRTLFESIDEGFCVIQVLLDAHDTPIDYRILEVNPIFEQQTGLQKAVGKTARQLNFEEHWIEIYGRVALTGESIRFENSSATLNRWFDVYACCTGEPEDRKVAIVFKDISDRKQAEEMAQRTAEANAFRVSLTDALRPLIDPIEMQAMASRLLGEYLGANRVAYFEVRGNNYVVEHDYVNGAAALTGSYPIDSFGPKLFAASCDSRTVSVSDVESDPNLSPTQRSAYAALQIGAHISIPLVKNGEFVAGLAVHITEPRVWKPEEVALAEEIAERTWAAVERARAEAVITADLQDMQLLHQLGARLVTEDDIHTLYQGVVSAAIALTRADAGTVQILDEATQELVLLIAQGFEPTMLKHFYRMNESSNTPCGVALKNGKRSFVDFDVPESENPDGSGQMLTEAGYRSGQSTPLITRSGKIIGMVSTQWRDHHRPSERELRFLDLLARQAADLIEQRQTDAALRDSENRLRMAIEAAQLGTWDWDLSTNHLIWDEGCKALFGLPPEAESSIEVFFIGLHPDDRERLEQVVQWTLNPASGGKYDTEYRTIGIQDGIEQWIAARGQVYFDAADHPQRFVGTVLNITEQKRIEVEREQLLAREQAARAAADRANRIKDEFLAVLSHELRSPLNPILGWAKLLRGGKLDSARTAGALATIERNAKLQSQLIDDLLDISRIMQGKLALNVASVSLAFVISSAIETVRLAAEVKSISIEVHIEPNVGQVLGDAGRLQQVVWNLLSNAVKFTPTGGRVEVRLTHVNHQAQLQVSDTGKGIRSEFLPYVFEHFRQEDGATTRKFGGLGLGLAIARQIVELHGGSIWVESLGEGQGATFTVELPFLQTVNPVEAMTDPILVQSDTPPLANLRVLVVDDELDSREFVAFVVEQAGAEVTAVNSAIEALQQLSTTSFDLLLSDIGMPEMDGYELMRQISKTASEPGSQAPMLAQPAALPAIALTAYAGEMNQQQALAVGFQAHISKPVEPDELIKAIVTMMG
ncbi:GAF domain-containing protein [Phormidium sp. CLA17]|uniref:GAF domain-containing protein n=1 Tax=Leptolyngbya sp. Cla-17 TaxID=2803751 RepID=UPI0018D88DF4|nr:GAF domain-containing protein [Leptolyngbya sp. Cla-17]MBM0744237.1 GAF domain-containing protein [Leptolyngbya sp. Cla-17]